MPADRRLYVNYILYRLQKVWSQWLWAFPQPKLSWWEKPWMLSVAQLSDRNPKALSNRNKIKSHKCCETITSLWLKVNSRASTWLLVFMLQVEWVYLEGSDNVGSPLHPGDWCSQESHTRKKSQKKEQSMDYFRPQPWSPPCRGALLCSSQVSKHHVCPDF